MDINGHSGEPSLPILQVQNLKKHFPIRAGLLRRQVGAVQAVDGVTFGLNAGEVMGVVGGKGSGKSTLARTILQLVKPTSGQVRLQGQDITKLGKNELRQIRRQMQLIFYDPYLSLNPRMRIHEIVGEPLQIHQIGDPATRMDRVNELLQLVDINPYLANRYPYELTGAMRQRVALARALASAPSVLIVDDFLTAVAPVVQHQLVSLLDRLRRQLGFTVLYIATDFSTVPWICDRIAVFYLGRIVEIAETAVITKHPAHPYTQYLLSLRPLADPKQEARRQPMALTDRAPNPAKPPAACRFHPRCPYATDVCRKQSPEFRQVGQATVPHEAACHHAEQFLPE